MPRPICMKCHREMMVKKNDMLIEEPAAFDMKMRWMADVLECPKCGNTIATNFGAGELVTTNMPEVEAEVFAR